MSDVVRARPRDYITPPFLVAAVGASAGGLDAFVSLLGPIPAESNLSLILVQHLSRTHTSVLPEVVARHTGLRVRTALDRMWVEVGCVYVIAPNTQMTVVDGHLRVAARPPGPQNLSVDALFSSLAEYYRHKAVGVILSGCLSDGTRGFSDIRAAGGTTISQRPSDAQFDGMPRSAISSGKVDTVLSAAEIGAELVRLSELPLFDQVVG